MGLHYACKDVGNLAEQSPDIQIAVDIEGLAQLEQSLDLSTSFGGEHGLHLGNAVLNTLVALGAAHFLDGLASDFLVLCKETGVLQF